VRIAPLPWILAIATPLDVVGNANRIRRDTGSPPRRAWRHFPIDRFVASQGVSGKNRL